MSTTHYHDRFAQAYASLNPAQQQAVDTIDGPVMVIAGPGTGKTQILTLRIANILLKTDTPPESILALTFTKSAAKAMRERLRYFVGAVAYRIPMYTFHSFCEQVIREYPEHFKRIIGARAISDLEQIKLLETVLMRDEVRLLRPFNAPDYYIKAILSAISNLKQENVSPDDLAQIIADEYAHVATLEQYHTKGAHKGKERSEYRKAVELLEKQQALLITYRYYQALLQQDKRYDFDDMVLETVHVLEESETVRLDLQERYHYLLADEHQDVNGAQNKIISLLMSYHDHPNLFVVGDEKQSIYRFQGASLENFLHFEEQYPDTKVIPLTTNYRSTQQILTLSHTLIQVETGPLLDYRIPLVAHAKDATGSVEIIEYEHDRYEHGAIVERVHNALGRGIPADEIAIIVRSNHEVAFFSTLLRSERIAVVPSADGDILSHPIFLAVLDLMTVIAEPTNDGALAAVLAAPYTHIPVSDVAALMSAVHYKQSLVQVLYDATIRATIPLSNSVVIDDFVATLVRLQAMSTTHTPPEQLAAALEETQFLAHVTGVDALEASRVIRRLYDEVTAMTITNQSLSLKGVLQLLRQRINETLPLTAPYTPDGTNGVRIMTAHKSKGLEFTVVIIPHVTDRTWAGKSRRDNFQLPLVRTAALSLEANEDERRLLYVAMTRAKRELYISYARLASDGSEQIASPFLLPCWDIVPLVVVPATPVAQSFAVKKTLGTNRIIPLLQRTLMTRGLSVTALNNIITNPWQYFFRNVIRLPEIKSPALHFGTVTHSLFEYMTSHHTKHGALPTINTMHHYLEQELSQLPISPTEFSALFEKGLSLLPSQINYLTTTLPKQTREEVSLRVTLTTVHDLVPELMLTGKLDRVDFTETGKALRVLDYKTGKPKSRNELEGNTKQANKDYRRQLAFYALLLTLHADERLYTPVGTVVFVEGDKKGQIKEESFTSDEVVQAELIEEIRSHLATLLTGQFITDDDLLAASDYAYLGGLCRSRLE